jgi:peptidyl-prolyl cis-trans isomerase C
MFSHHRRILIHLCMALGISLSACTYAFKPPPTPTPTAPIPTLTPVPPTPTPPPLAATVNGEYITLAELEAEVDRYQAAQKEMGNTVSDKEARQAVLDDLVDQLLLAQEARKAGFALGEADLQARLDALAGKVGGVEALAGWQSAHGYDDVSFWAALKRAAEAAWMRDKIVADVPLNAEQVHIQQILTYNEDDARQVLANIRGGMNFNELAQLYDPVTHGELGWVPRGYLLDPKVEEAAFSLEAGATSDVIQTAAGFHIIKVLERGVHPLSPDALLSVQEQALKEWLSGKRSQSEITVAP